MSNAQLCDEAADTAYRLAIAFTERREVAGKLIDSPDISEDDRQDLIESLEDSRQMALLLTEFGALFRDVASEGRVPA